jgi:hypothetical protein
VVTPRDYRDHCVGNRLGGAARDVNRLACTWHSFSAQGKKLGGAGALYLAAAIHLRSDYLMTQDGGFPLGQTVEDVRVMLLEQVWQPTLLDQL